ncbi:MAG: hypothetical protein NTX25_02320 [Proteobacteria bacterium]|nr:hypothetical protein [Pseudomonadota bacterium]
MMSTALSIFLLWTSTILSFSQPQSFLDQNLKFSASKWPAVVLNQPFPGSSFGCKYPYPSPWRCENFNLEGVDQGSFLSINRSGAEFLLAAPHGRFDQGTDAIAYSIFPPIIPPGQPVWSQLIAHSFRSNSPSGLQHNVNRPSTLHQDVCDDPPELYVSKLVYQGFTQRLDELVPRPLLYFEIHGQNEAGLENTIEVATDRISAREAISVRDILYEELQRAGIPTIQVTIQPIDSVYFGAGKAKQCGSLHHVYPAPAIHTELPKILRDGDEAQRKTAVFYRAILLRLANEIFTVDRQKLAL